MAQSTNTFANDPVREFLHYHEESPPTSTCKPQPPVHTFAFRTPQDRASFVSLYTAFALLLPILALLLFDGRAIRFLHRCVFYLRGSFLRSFRQVRGVHSRDINFPAFGLYDSEDSLDDEEEEDQDDKMLPIDRSSVILRRMTSFLGMDEAPQQLAAGDALAPHPSSPLAHSPPRSVAGSPKRQLEHEVAPASKRVRGETPRNTPEAQPLVPAVAPVASPPAPAPSAPGVAARRILRPRTRNYNFSSSPPGLVNRGQQCYMNSVVQGLASLSTLPRYLRSIVPADGDVSDVQRTAELIRFLRQLNNCHQAVSTRKVPAVLCWESYGEQQDAHEYFNVTMDWIDEEAKQQAQRRASQGSLSPTENGVANIDNVARPQFPLEGMTGQRVSCKTCGYSDGVSMSPFNVLTLNLGERGRSDIQDLLDDLTELEDVDDVTCLNCTLNAKIAVVKKLVRTTESESARKAFTTQLKVLEEVSNSKVLTDDIILKKCEIPKANWIRTTKTKQQAIAKPPQAIVFHINRSVFTMTGHMRKNRATVTYPEVLDLTEWCIRDHADAHPTLPLTGSLSDTMLPNYPPTANIPGSPFQYGLRAVVVHHGSTHNYGHYTCYRQYPRVKLIRANEVVLAHYPGWWKCDDELVSNVSEGFALGQGQVFMLFYELVKNAQGPEQGILEMAKRTKLPEDSLDEKVAMNGGAVGSTGTKPKQLKSYMKPTVEDTKDDYEIGYR